MLEQLIAEVGVSRMMGCSTTTVEVGIISVSAAHALRIKMLVMENNKIKKIRFMGVSIFSRSADFSPQFTEKADRSPHSVYVVNLLIYRFL